jgi:hypothetical protein
MSGNEPIKVDPDGLHKGADALLQFAQVLQPLGQRLKTTGQKVLAAARSDGDSGVGAAVEEGTGAGVETVGAVFDEAGRVVGKAGQNLHTHAENYHGVDETAANAYTKVHQSIDGEPEIIGPHGTGGGSDMAPGGSAAVAGWGGAEPVFQPSKEAAEAYDRIRARADDVPAVAANTGVSPAVVARVKDHIFMQEHDIQYGPNQVYHGNFMPMDDTAKLWEKATNGQLTDEEGQRFRAWASHEYVESNLMQAGMPYHSPDPEAWQPDGYPDFNPNHFGAHEASPRSGDG